MEPSILIYSVTISWIYLAYIVNKPYIKEYLNLVVAVNLISMIYVMVAVTGIFDFQLYRDAAQIHLMANVCAFIGFILFYLLEWTIKHLKMKKESKQRGEFD